MPASVEPAQLGMPAPLSRPSRASAPQAHIVGPVRRRAPTAALAMHARRHLAQQLLLQPCVLLVRSAALVTRYARTAPPLLALAARVDQRRPLGHCVWRASSVSEAVRRVVTAVQGTHVPPPRHRRRLQRRYVLRVRLVRLEPPRAATVGRHSCLVTSASLALSRAVVSHVPLAPSALVPG
jgi:hypothetical protein